MSDFDFLDEMPQVTFDPDRITLKPRTWIIDDDGWQVWVPFCGVRDVGQRHS